MCLFAPLERWPDGGRKVNCTWWSRDRTSLIPLYCWLYKLGGYCNATFCLAGTLTFDHSAFMVNVNVMAYVLTYYWYTCECDTATDDQMWEYLIRSVVLFRLFSCLESSKLMVLLHYFAFLTFSTFCVLRRLSQLAYTLDFNWLF